MGQRRYDKGLSLRLERGDVASIDRLLKAAPVLSTRSGAARAAFKAGLKLIESDPSVLLRS